MESDQYHAYGNYKPDLNNDSGSDDSDTEETKVAGVGKSRDSTAMLDTWLAELDSLTTEMDSRPVDPFRFSQATLEDTQEDELNAILGELSALQMSLDREMKQPTSPNTDNHILETGPRSEQCSNKPISTSSDNGVRTDSPDNDSGFSDNASLLSSGSSLSASGSSSGSSTASCRLKTIPPSTVLHANELADYLSARLESGPSTVPNEKAEKIRVALAKMRAASVTRLYVKAFSPDGSSKALMVEETMSCGRVLALLADKNHVPLSHKWALVEHIPHLHMERIYEEHENMVENLLMWTRDSKNKIYFVERDDKYDMFHNPQRYFMESRQDGSAQQNIRDSSQQHGMDEHTKHGLIDEFFNQGVGVPEVESFLYLKAEGKKAWKKFAFVLRASGIYYYPKGRSHSSSSKDLVCLATIDHNQQAYEGVGWRKKFKAPTEYGFVLKPARLQVKSHRHMKYLCAEDPDTLRLWMVGLRIAKHGKQLWDNYRSLQEEIAHEDLDRFGRSVSLASMPIQISTQMGPSSAISSEQQVRITPIRRFSAESGTVPNNYATPVNINNPNNIHNLENPSERTVLANPAFQTIVGREEGFESDCPVGGTIKRKPSTVLSPKIPLTLNTRSLVSEYITAGEGNTVTLNHTLQRKRSVSGNSGGNGNGSSCSSSSSSVVSQTYAMPTCKPPMGNRLPSTKPVSVAEETFDSLEYENLPPPPPELLMSSDDEMNQTKESLNNSQNQYTVPTPPPLLGKYPGTGTLPNPIAYAPKPLIGSNSHSLPKKGVSFANELTQRLQSRNNPAAAPAGNPRPNLNVNFASSPNPSKLSDPPLDFLSDLQRVMQKKWQVAQKCNLDKDTSPQEILGFRFEPNSSGKTIESPTSEECQSENGDVNPVTLNNVRAWVSQHYGNSVDDLPQIYSSQEPKVTKPIPPVPNAKPQQRVSFSLPVVQPQPTTHPSPNFPPPPPPAAANPNAPGMIYRHDSLPTQPSVVIYENFQGRKSSLQQMHHPSNNHVQLRNKKPPPPIPKRADSTHLSAHFVYN